MRIGIISVQGAFHEHASATRRAMEATGRKGEVVQVRRPEHAEACHGFILPGGESTAIYKLLSSSGLFEHLGQAMAAGTPVLATCAGTILLASKGDEAVERTGTELFGVLDAAVERNAFGRQKESFEAPVRMARLGEDPFPGVFIRAPAITGTWGQAAPFARLEDGRVVGAEQDHLLALTFHPELSADTRVHGYFLDKVDHRLQALGSDP